MTLNDLIINAKGITDQLTSGSIPIMMNGKEVYINLTLCKKLHGQYYIELLIKSDGEYGELKNS